MDTAPENAIFSFTLHLAGSEPEESTSNRSSYIWDATLRRSAYERKGTFTSDVGNCRQILTNRGEFTDENSD